MFDSDPGSSVVAASTVGRSRRCRPAGRRPSSSRATPGSVTGLFASEESAVYDTDAGDTDADTDEAGHGWGDHTRDHTGKRADGDPDGAGLWNGPTGSAPRATEARTRLTRCATTPGSPLGTAMRALGEAIGTLAATAVLPDTGTVADPSRADGAGLAGEHVDVVGDALVAVQHLRARLDACALALLASFDQRGGHRADGAVSVSSWLAGRTGTDYSSAARQATTARRLAGLPRLAAHLAAGDITLAHATAVTDRCVPARAEQFSEFEPILANLAATNPPRDLRHAVRRLLELNDPDGADGPDHPDGDPLRELRLSAGFQGRGQLGATLDPPTREALTVLLDAFDTPDPAGTPPQQRRTPSQRRHDAFAAMLHTLLAQPGLPTVQGARPQILITIDLANLLGLPPDHPAAAVTLADLADWLGIDLPVPDGPDPEAADPDGAAPTVPDAETTAGPTGPAPPPVNPAAPDTAPDTGSRRPAAMPGPPRPPPRPPRFGSGVPVSAATVRGLLPAATIMAVLTLGPWRAVNVGNKHRTLPAWLRTVLAAFHVHCRGPDCDHPAAWTEAHHITPWASARTTDLNDTLPLCPPHHQLTDEGWTATLDHATGTVTWTSPTGRTITVPAPNPWPCW